MDRQNELVITGMQKRHIEALAEIEKECFSAPWSYEGLAEELANPSAYFLVAEVSGSAAGYAGMYHVIDEGYITNIAVKKELRNRGIARSLLRKFDEFASENGLSFISLEVRKSNIPAINLYLSEGYRQEGERRDFYSNPAENALIMTKRYK